MNFVVVCLLLAGTGGSTGKERTRLEGERTLHAEGSGLIYLKGQGSLTISGEGSLWYKDLAGDAQVPERFVSESGWVFVSGMGNFSIAGSDFILMALGKDMVIDAEGKGKAQLAGKGFFEVHNRSGAWADELNPIPYGPTPIKPKEGKGEKD
ncbi:MAG: hypothetical protein ACP5QG_00910 [candidate division WOR-3 bacterium]